MKKLIIYVCLAMTPFNGIIAQITRHSEDSIYQCEITDLVIKAEIQSYIERNFKKNVEKGLVVVKVPSIGLDKKDYVFYISQIIRASSIRSTRPDAFSRINGHIVLIYGLQNIGKLSNKSYHLCSQEFQKFLIDDYLEQNKTKDGDTLNLFDPEILKIMVKNNSIVARKELSKELDLKN